MGLREAKLKLQENDPYCSLGMKHDRSTAAVYMDGGRGTYILKTQ